MNLLAALDRFSEAFGALTTHVEPWEEDEEEFLRHFGQSVEEFAERVSLLDPEQVRKLEATLRVNPEAAVLWVLAMDIV